MSIDFIVIAIYLMIILGAGFLGWKGAKTRDDYTVAGRKLGPVMFTGTMSATVLGGASTIGTISLGYIYGISGFWLAASLGLGLIFLSLFLVDKLFRLKLNTVTHVFELRYRPAVRLVGGVVMMCYDLMVAVTSMIAIGAIMKPLLGADFQLAQAIWVGGGIVVAYVFLGGMWSLTMTDIIQFVMMTVCLFFILLPESIHLAGGWEGMKEVLPNAYFSPTHIGYSTITTYFLIYTLGVLIGQDIWQRIFTARAVGVAKWGGVASGLYCICWGGMGAMIGMAGRVFLPNLDNPDTAFSEVVQVALPVGLRGLVAAAALAALMSTASACIMATSTIGVHDLYSHFFGKEKTSLVTDRCAILIAGVLMLVIASLIGNVIAALTIAYDLLVGALLIPLVGAVSWRRASTVGAMVAIVLGSAVVLSLMVKDGVLATSPIYYGMGANLVAFVLASLLWPDAKRKTI